MWINERCGILLSLGRFFGRGGIIVSVRRCREWLGEKGWEVFLKSV